jgi:FPC/CPF motif-containing protein YcgG
MMNIEPNHWVEEYQEFVANRAFPCIAAKAALAEEQIKTLVVEHLACPGDDLKILDFLYMFIDEYRQSQKLYHSAVVIFKQPRVIDETSFGDLMWQRLQSISDLDALRNRWDSRVSNDPTSPDFSYSVKEEAMYVIGLHEHSSRTSRQFRYPAFVFNPHQQFVKLRETGKYTPMKEVVRKRDLRLSGSVNPMLSDFGESSEALQYSGKRYEEFWKCPFVSSHGASADHSTP